MRSPPPFMRLLLRNDFLAVTIALSVIACSDKPANSASGNDVDSAGLARTAIRVPLDSAGRSCDALERRDANAPKQQPAFARQTRACELTSSVAFDVTVMATGLDHPWAVEPMPGGDLLVSEKSGQLRIVSAGGVIGEPIVGIPAVSTKGQGGLLDLALSPTFGTDRTIFFSFVEPRAGGNATSVASGVLSSDRRALSNVTVLFRASPSYDGDKHYGSRLAFGPDGMLYITLGERSDTPMRPQAQQLSSDMGKIVRIKPDGTVPSDNPFIGQPGARPEIWSVGHRNVQAAAFDPSGRLWEVEHGVRGGDELNLVVKGKNYGWPVQAYGEEYSGALPITSALGPATTATAGTEQPVYYWDPVIAPSGAQWYSGAAFPAWQGSLFIGGMKDKLLVRLVLKDDHVVGEEHLLADRGQRVRDVRQGPDGLLYLVTDQANGELWKVSPRGTTTSMPH